MTDYIEQLKNYWKSKDLAFIAIFKRINKNAGFFNHFTNPVSKMKLYYPEFDGVEVLDKRVSFYYGNNSRLLDGAYYKIELEHTDNPKGKNNPYALEIKSVSELNQNKIEKLLCKDNEPNKYEGIPFYGCYEKKNERFASFENVMNADSGEILTNQNESQNVYVSPNIELIEGRYYSFSIIDNKDKRPSAIKSSIEELNINPYQQHIDFRFSYLNNPGANKSLAATMTEIGKGMYSSKQRMIFELLQNADDAPGRDKVGFHIDFNGDYFFIMHDGAPFSKNDVEAITRSGESTKRDNKKVTGYKGIGFKSVFTDSSEVWIKSGGYQFSFLRDSKLFEDFDSFYFSDERYKKYPDLLVKDKEKYRFDRLNFKGAEDIPWQLIPIWQNKLPDEFQVTNFDFYKNPVQIALRLGKSNINDYQSAIENITKRPQFLLFLRNTSRFNSPKNPVLVIREDENDLVKITLLKGPTEEKYFYKKIVFDDIKVSDEAFASSNIALLKSSQVNDYNEITYFFTDLEGNKITSIPPKIASVSESEVSFGFFVQNNKLTSEPGYVQDSSQYSSLFTYLPMEDKRFKLPFLVNGDFVPDSRREEIQGDNLWNKYIISKIAQKHVEILRTFALKFEVNPNFYSDYLSLLLKNPLPEDDTAQQIIESYNAKYLEQLENTEIVVNDNDQIQLLSDTIIDDSGLIELFGNEIFYDIIDTEKRLPNSNLDAKYLKDYDYLDIEVIDLEELAEQITPELCENLGSIIAQRALYENPDLLKWLNRLVKFIPVDFGKIPFIVHNNSPFSLEQLIDEDDAWLINEHTSQYVTLIGELGYHTVQLNLDKYSNIKEFLHSINGYINDKTLAYERIASNANIHQLPVSSKLELIDFFQKSKFMVGIGETKYFGELKLFIDESDNPRPIKHLISREEDLKVSSINKFRIKETEFNSLTDDLQKQLITKDKIFTSFILDKKLFEEWSKQFDTKNINNYVSDLKAMHSWIDNPDDISSAQWASIPWLYVDDEVRFETPDKVYWSKAFKDLSADKFEIIKSVFHKAELKILPVQVCGALIKAFQIKTDDSSDMDWSEIEELEMMVANTLLDWLEDDGGFGDFFKNYTIVENTKGNFKIGEIEAIQIFDGSDKDLTAYIQSNTELSLIFNELDKNLCSENRSMIGLLQGDRLIKAIIESSDYDQNLALHLPSNVSSELQRSFIDNLNEFKLFTSSDYGGDTPEHFIISRLLKNVESINEIAPELQNTIDTLRSKTSIDSIPLSNYTVSDRVSFGTKEDRKVLKLSDILTEFQGESDVLDNVKKSFTAITQKAKLRELIFKTIPLTPIEIYTRIESDKNTYYTVFQVVFQLLDKKYGGRRNWSKQRFDKYFLKQESVTQLHNSYDEFLEVLIKIPFTELSDFTFKDLNLNNCVDKNFAIESERIPNWLEAWVNIDTVKRLAFISQLGYNGSDSAIVNLRKSMVNTEYDQNSVIRYFDESKPNMQIIWNTILWLANYNPNIVTQNISVIKQVNDYIRFKADSIAKITVPLIKSINTEGVRIYSLQAVSVETELLKINIQSEFSDSIISSLNNSLTNPNCIDESIGKFSDYLNITAVKLEESVDIKTLESKSKLWDEPFYKKWEHSNDYPIYIYDGDGIPYTRSFKNIIVNRFVQDLKVASEGKYYVSSILRGDLLDYLPDSFPKDKLNELKEWERKTLKDPSLMEENPLEENYNETFDRMIQDQYGISEDRQNDENSNAKRQVLYYLKENGYEVNEGHSKNNFAALYGIKDSEGNNIDFIVKSARGGLLFINKSHWEMLDSSHTQLIAIYPKFEMRIFRNKMELLSDELQEKVLFRMPNKRSEQEIDDVFEKTESDSHLILVSSKLMKESLFEKVGKNGNFNKNEEANVMGENIVIE